MIDGSQLTVVGSCMQYPIRNDGNTISDAQV